MFFDTFVSSRWICGDDRSLPPEAEDGLLHDPDVHPLHHDSHPLPSVLLDQQGVGPSENSVRYAWRMLHLLPFHTAREAKARRQNGMYRIHTAFLHSSLCTSVIHELYCCCCCTTTTVIFAADATDNWLESFVVALCHGKISNCVMLNIAILVIELTERAKRERAKISPQLRCILKWTANACQSFAF